MQKYYLWILMVFGVFCSDASAQSLKRKVIASAGGVMKTNQYQFSYTIGETVIQKHSTGQYVFSQGFQQNDWTSRTQNLMSLSAYAEENLGKLLLITVASLETDYLVLERLDNQTGIYEKYEIRNIVIGRNTMTQLSFTDNEPQDGDNYYRIKQVFNDGSFRYSDVQKLNFNTSSVNIYPNPSTEYVKVDLSSYQGKDATVSLFSTNGHLVLEQKFEKVGKQAVNIALDGIESGHYQILIQVKGKRPVAKQLIITK